ncbi:hypothetical protein Glove_579g37 [Diversispora epigaea]|uniref:Uncharacterized protein n=1 Tax=Diversispora epigaea TaxID=1348612 RepID=A0A397GCY1_9GLOM|nr:hypothetical protein Glove_579g37 [Diversispora epigaea]
MPAHKSNTFRNEPFPCYLCIINHFRAAFLQDVDSKLSFHRTTEGIKRFQWKFSESLFYFLFSSEPGFSYKPSIRNIPAAQIQNPNVEIPNVEIPNPKSQITISIFCRNPKSQIPNTRKSGYKQIGIIFTCEVWGRKQNKLGSKSFVLVEERNNNESLFYFLFSSEPGKSGYKQIGIIFTCEVWGRKQNKLGSKSFVLVEERNNNGMCIEKKIVFTWREKTIKKVKDEKSLYILCGILECILEVRHETVEIVDI